MYGDALPAMLSTPELAALTGQNVQTLLRWYRAGFIVPSIYEAGAPPDGHAWSWDDLVRVRAILALRGPGTTTARAVWMLDTERVAV